MAEEEAKIEEVAESEDDSMEDILHSIRDIISDEDDSDAEAADDKSADDEVLDLTEVADSTPSEDVLSDIDAALESTEEKPAEAEAPAEVAEKVATETAPEPEEKPAPVPAAPIKAPSTETILDETTAVASKTVMKELISSIPRPDIERKDFRTGNTVEDLVLEGLKPMLKEWLDGNLENLVREIVEREIKKLLPHE